VAAIASRDAILSFPRHRDAVKVPLLDVTSPLGGHEICQREISRGSSKVGAEGLCDVPLSLGLALFRNVGFRITGNNIGIAF